MKKHLSDKKSTRSLCNDIRHQIRFGKLPRTEQDSQVAKYQFLATNDVWVRKAP